MVTMKLPQKQSADTAALVEEALRKHQGGEIAAAEVIYRHVLKTEPNHYTCLHMLAVIGCQTNQHEESLKLFRKAEPVGKSDPAFLVNFGAALKNAKKPAEALEKYDLALALKPDIFEALYNKAQLLNELKRYDEALATSKQCMSLRPDNAEAITSYGIALKNVGRWIEALDCFEEAIDLNRNLAFPHICMGEVLRSHGWMAAAEFFYDRALQIEPRNPIARTHRSLNALKQGRLEEGWKDYDGRFWHVEEQVPRRPVPPIYWDGEDLHGKKLLIWTEQGVGDAIIYSSMISELAERASEIWLECEPRLVPIFSRSFPSVKVFTLRDTSGLPAPKTPTCDYQISIGSLGRYLRPTMASFRRHNGYLRPDPEKVATFRQRYGRGPIVGLSWHSSARLAGRVKSVSLIEWGPILKIPGVRFVSLQYGNHDAEIAEVQEKYGVVVIQDSSVNALKNMDGFLAQVAAMDLVISVSNTTAHVAGAAGISTWLALPNKGLGLWYWFQRRADSPWYPSMSIFRGRVEHVNDAFDGAWWGNIVDQLASELLRWSKLTGAK